MSERDEFGGYTEREAMEIMGMPVPAPTPLQDRPVIPEQAVEAAALALSSRNGERFDVMARAALEAAAPYIAESSNDVQWGVRDKASLRIAGHPSEESARLTAAAHPNWYEVVSRPRPKPEPRWEVS